MIFFRASAACLAVFQLVNLTVASPLTTVAPEDHAHLVKRAAVIMCAEDSAAVLRAAMTEVNAMLQATVTATQALYAYINQINVPDLSAQTGELQNVVRTFETIFGEVYFGGNTPLVNALGVARVKKILDLSSELLNSVDNIENTYIQFYCDDSWLKDDPFAQVPYSYLDGRPGEEPTAVVLSRTSGTCRDPGNTLYALTINFPTTLTSVVTLCQQHMADWVSSWNSGQTLTNAKATGIPVGTGIGVFNTILSATLIHELTHAATLVSSGIILSDESCDTASGAATAYGFQCVCALGQQDATRAINNADSFKFYATAMYLNECDWSRGDCEQFSMQIDD